MSYPVDSKQTAAPVVYSLVIPVFNEEENLAPLHAELSTVLDRLGKPYEVLYVDDGSTDRSLSALQELHSRHPEIRVIQFRRNYGQTAAFSAGFDYARGELIITLDADGQNDPADIPRLLEVLQSGDHDIVVGWRVNRRESAARRLLSSAANRLISRSTHITVHDRGCSLKVFRSEVAKNMRLYGQMHRFLPELASVVGASVAEVPVNDRSRKFGKSKYGALTRTPRVLLDMITVFYLLSFFTSPMRFFGSVGLATGGLGFFTGGAMALAKIVAGLTGGWEAFHAYQIGNRPLLLLAGLLVLVGVQFLMMGLLGEMVMRTYYEAQGKPIYFVRKVIE